MKLIRYIFFIPICFLALGLVYWGFGFLMNWFINLSTFWMIIILIFFGGAIWGIFKGLSALLMSFASQISPNKNFSFWTILVLSGINGIWAIYNSWTMPINYSGKIIFAAIVMTILILELTFALIYGAAATIEDEY